MIDFKKITKPELDEFKNVITTFEQRSPLMHFSLYTQDVVEKAKVFLWCYRFVLAFSNVIQDGDLRKEVVLMLEESRKKYEMLNDLLFKVERTEYMKFLHITKIKSLVLYGREVDELIDLFALLLERVNIIRISKLKGIELEGNSGKAFKEIMNKEQPKEELSEEDEFPEEVEEPQEEFVENLPKEEVLEQQTQTEEI